MSINRTFVRHKSAGGTSLPKHRDCIWSTTCSLNHCMKLYSHCMGYRYWSDLQARYRDDVAGNATVAETIAVGRSVLIVLAQETD